MKFSTTLLALAISIEAATIQVPGGQSTIQGAIASSQNGDTIVVAPGTYNEDLDFLGKSITLTSTAGAASTIINGSGQQSVIAFNSGGTGATVNGFTIQNGNAAFQNTYEGGGISIEAGSPTITNNIIHSNHSCAGAGVAVGFANPIVQNNVITGNSPAGCSGGIGGGGISVRGGSPQILGNTITSNQSSQFGGGISLFAAGSPLIRNNIISGNNNGGITTANASSALIVQNLITGNMGGGLVPAQGTIVNNTIANNAIAAIDGVITGAMLINNLVIGAAGVPALLCSTSDSTGTFDNNDIYSPGGLSFGPQCDQVTGSAGNISADPLFISPGTGNYRLLPGSPAIDAGLNSAPGLTATDLDGLPRIVAGAGGAAVIDMGAYEFPGPALLGISGSSLSFGNEQVGNTGSNQTISVSNTGTVNGYLALSITGDFVFTTTCEASLAPGSNCLINVAFRPLVQGSRTGVLTIVSNTAKPLPAISLSGTGVNPEPVLLSISPASAVVGSNGFVLAVSGSNFVGNSEILWNGQALATTFVSSAQLAASIPAADIASAGTAQVSVYSPSPGGGATQSLSFTTSNPRISAGGVVNGASYTSALAPGSFATLFGSSLATGVTDVTTLPLPTTAGNVSVTISGYGAPIFYVSPTQISFQIPWELQGQSQASVFVSTNGIASNTIDISLSKVAPALLSTNSQGTGQGAILVAGTATLADPSRPVNRTEAISIFAIGLGPVTNVPPSGNTNPLSVLSDTIGIPTVTVGGTPGMVQFSGLAPGLVGVYQVNVQMPLNAPVGNAVPVVMTLDGNQSNTVTIAVQ
jgi:uncharacterized protein (TIGR03437 family)